jgi:hypothetical protein
LLEYLLVTLNPAGGVGLFDAVVVAAKFLGLNYENIFIEQREREIEER